MRPFKSRLSGDDGTQNFGLKADRATRTRCVENPLRNAAARHQRIQELQAELAYTQRLMELGQVVATLVHEVSPPIADIKNYLGGHCQLNLLRTPI
jgi:hypothetical protein